MAFTPSYLTTVSRSELERRIRIAYERMENCSLCPRGCGIDRFSGELGVCQAPAELMISSVSPHFGEEPPLVGRYGSGTIFLTHCSLRCVFCQNYDISHMGRGAPYAPEDLAKAMLSLQNLGCHNINFVTPTHYTPGILQGLLHAIDGGLRIPLVYNCGGYESMETLELLNGIIDIYMPDMKFLDPELSTTYMDSPDYPEITRKALLTMYTQVGDLAIDSFGIASRGLLVRHLVMPGYLENTRQILEFVARKISKSTYVNIMDQYYPMYRSREYEHLSRRLSREEFEQACRIAREVGLHRGFY